MLRRQTDSTRNDRIDRIGRSIVTVAAAGGEQEAADACSSPFLYARLRSRINRERQRLDQGDRWIAMAAVLRRAIPAMSIVTMLAFGLLGIAVWRAPSQAGVSVDELLAGNDAQFERIAFADRGALSNDEVLSAILDEHEAAR